MIEYLMDRRHENKHSLPDFRNMIIDTIATLDDSGIAPNTVTSDQDLGTLSNHIISTIRNRKYVDAWKGLLIVADDIRKEIHYTKRSKNNNAHLVGTGKRQREVLTVLRQYDRYMSVRAIANALSKPTDPSNIRAILMRLSDIDYVDLSESQDGLMVARISILGKSKLDYPGGAV